MTYRTVRAENGLEDRRRRVIEKRVDGGAGLERCRDVGGALARSANRMSQGLDDVLFAQISRAHGFCSTIECRRLKWPFLC